MSVPGADASRTPERLGNTAVSNPKFLSSIYVGLDVASKITNSKELARVQGKGRRYRAQRNFSRKLVSKNIQPPVRWSSEVYAIEDCRKACTAIGHPHMFIHKRTMAPVLYTREAPIQDSIFATFEYLQPNQISHWHRSRRSLTEQQHDKLNLIMNGSALAKLLESVSDCFSSVDIQLLTIVDARSYQASHPHLHTEKGKPDIEALKRARELNMMYRKRREALCSAQMTCAKTMQERMIERKARKQRRYLISQRTNQASAPGGMTSSGPLGADEIKLIRDSEKLTTLLEQSDREILASPVTSSPARSPPKGTIRFVSKKMPLSPLV